MVKFTADASTNASMIYLHDETSFQLLENNFEGFFQYNDGTTMPAGATDYENAMIPWEDVKAFAEFTPTAAENDSWTAEDYQTLFEMLRVSCGRRRAPPLSGARRTWPTTRTAWRCSTG